MVLKKTIIVDGDLKTGGSVVLVQRSSIEVQLEENNLKVELDSLIGQATVLAALAFVSPKLPLGYPARFPRTLLDVARKMLIEASRNTVVATVEKEVGWLLLPSLLTSMPKEEMEDQVFDIHSLWADVFSGHSQEHQANSYEDLSYKIRLA
ncbi:unnamed protein product [Lactuca saligna]|uniref:Uncharacterized protein n=1 Tax=Lactuca saligna TaxID=75948 RepID=A0AA35ZQU0_LACSI|nr:unnamed protein product [Lactuca saligna]